MKKITMSLLFVTLSLILAACGGPEEGTLTVGLECDYAPFNWTSTSEGVEISGSAGACDGYDITVAQEIAAELGMELRIRKIEWLGLIPALNTGEIDLIIAGMSPTEERKESVLFSDAYFRSEQVLVVRRESLYADAEGLEDFSGARIIAQQGTLQDDLITQIPDVDHASPLSDYGALVEQVTSGVSDGLVAELPVALSITQNNENLVMVQLGDSGFTVDESDITVSIALRHGEEALRDEINAILASIDDATRQAWMEEALINQP